MRNGRPLVVEEAVRRLLCGTVPLMLGRRRSVLTRDFSTCGQPEYTAGRTFVRQPVLLQSIGRKLPWLSPRHAEAYRGRISRHDIEGTEVVAPRHEHDYQDRATCTPTTRSPAVLVCWYGSGAAVVLSKVRADRTAPAT